MKSIKLAIIYGFLVWLIPFVVSIVIFPLHDSQRPLFESIMPVTGVISVVIFSTLYLKKSERNYLREGIFLGITFLTISLFLDFLLFVRGPFAMSLGDYVKDIGITYLSIPIIIIGFGYLLAKKSQPNLHQDDKTV
jgi:hypothetical protein